MDQQHAGPRRCLVFQGWENPGRLVRACRQLLAQSQQSKAKADCLGTRVQTKGGVKSCWERDGVFLNLLCILSTVLYLKKSLEHGTAASGKVEFDPS